MISTIFKKVVGSKNERVLRKLLPLVEKINSLESDMKSLPDDALQSKNGSIQGTSGTGRIIGSAFTRSLRSGS